jgi:hypothetical protein
MAQAPAGADIGKLMSSLKSVSPPPNPGTPNSRKTPNDKFLERIASMRAIVKAINSESPPDDPQVQSVMDIFNETLTDMLFRAQPELLIKNLTQRIGALAPMPMQGAPAPIAPLTPPMGGGPPGPPMGGGPPAQVQSPVGSLGPS